MKKYNRPLIYLIIIFLVAGLLIFIKAKNSNSLKTLSKKLIISSESSSKNYTSKALKLTISVPAKFQIQDNLGRILINAKNGQIIIVRASTNFESVIDYLNFIKAKNHFQLKEQQDIQINSYLAISGFKNGEKIYFIYADGWVYTLSTSSEALYSDLDQIAQSFKYTP